MAAKAKSDWGRFALASDKMPRRLIWRSWGPEKTGKNYLGLSAPGPIAVHCFDVLGLEGVVEQFRRTKEVRVCKYHFRKTADNRQEQAIDIRDQFLEDLEVSKRNARTIQVDESELFEVFRYAEFGDKSDNPTNYDKLYADYRAWIHAFDDTDINLQLIQKVKEKWEQFDATDKNGRKVTKGRPSGNMQSTGYKDLRYVVKANIEHSWDAERGFVLRVENCTYNMGIAGQEFENVDFATLAQLVFPESEESEWE